MGGKGKFTIYGEGGKNNHFCIETATCIHT